MAPSSIPNAGFVISTTRSIAAGSPIQSYPDAPSIPAFDANLHSERSLNKKTLRHWAQMEYFWSGDGYNGFEAFSSEDNVMTLGSLANYHPYLCNVKPVDSGHDDSRDNDTQFNLSKSTARSFFILSRTSFCVHPGTYIRAIGEERLGCIRDLHHWNQHLNI